MNLKCQACRDADILTERNDNDRQRDHGDECKCEKCVNANHSH